MTFFDVFASQTVPMKIWLVWMFAVNGLSVFFLRHPPARWVLGAMAANVIFMQLLFKLYGTGHHLSLPHVLFWTPLLLYLFVQRRRILANGYPYIAWCIALVVTDTTSLVFDYSAVVHLVFE